MNVLPEVGQVRSMVVCAEVTRTQIVQYAGASGDFSPLHTDEPAARAAGNASIMAHGMMTMALSSQIVTSWFGADSLRTFGVRFTAPVWPGDRLTTTATIAAVDTHGSCVRVRITLKTTNDDGLPVLHGDAVVTVDSNSKLK
ncbi:MaoC family dehydratase [Candidatus Protofrankia californiensis]|uniref:MaoC family dehydratase n=1 Tax=Candidatus Protofrankia californiensis TaxID=1839754 RepID=UPI0010412D83|nr:MaoC/PaaZ C-terminal domain-containing protein [Candidatus Protofrankia californiensis]